jgi:hypothetical protein
MQPEAYAKELMQPEAYAKELMQPQLMQIQQYNLELQLVAAAFAPATTHPYTVCSNKHEFVQQ